MSEEHRSRYARRRMRGLGLLLWGLLSAASWGADAAPWQEPTWREAGADTVTLRLKFNPGEQAQYQVTNKGTVARGGQTREIEETSTETHQVLKVLADGSAQVQITYAGPPGMPSWGRFTLSPTGQTGKVVGMVGRRSLPVFPAGPVRLGAQWDAPAEVLVSANAPDAVARGTCRYRLTGLADVGGRRWARITLECTLELAKQPWAQKLIGVQLKQGATAGKEGTPPISVLPDTPAGKAGLQSGDVIVALGGMPTRSFGDLVCLGSLLPLDKPSKVTILRDGQRKELAITPRVGRSGSIQAKGSVKGRLVLDVTAGRIVRVECDPMSLGIQTWVGNEMSEQQIALRAVMQRVEPTQQGDTAAIRALIDKINRSWTGPQHTRLMGEAISDKSFTFAMPRPKEPSEAAVLDKAGFCRAFEGVMANSQPRLHKHEITSITVTGPLAYELGVTHEVRADGQKSDVEIANVFAKDKTGWKLIFSTFGQPLRLVLRAPESDAEIVRRLALDFVDSFGIGGPPPRTKVEDILADDVAFVWSNGKAATGKATCLDWRAKALEEVRANFKAFALRYDIRSVRLFADTAVVLGKLDISGTQKEGDQPFRREVWETLIFVKTPASWRLIEEHSTPATAQ